MKKNYSKNLSKRLGGYGSLALALTGLTEANSQVVYTDVNPDYSGSLGSSYAIDFDNDGIDDIILNNSGGGVSYYGGIISFKYAGLYANPQGSNAVLGSMSYGFAYPLALNSGNTISSNAGSFFNNTNSNLMNFYYSFNYYGSTLSSGSFGKWTGATDKYLGIKFDISGQTHYGWIRLDVDKNSSFSVKDFAYETTPNKAISAGDQVGSLPCASPTALSIGNFNEDSVNFSWTASPDETDGYNWAVFAAGADINTATPVATGNVATGILNASATGLSPNTPYDIYVQTKCSSNNSSNWEGPQTFTTVAIPCATPTALSIDNFNEDSVNFSWTASPDETDGYNWAVFAVGADINTATPVATGNVATGILNASATGLSSETPYDVYVQTNCALNTSSDWEGPQNFTTDAIPCATPTDLSIDTFTEDSVNFSWTASPDETDGYKWAVFAAGANINTATPVATGDVVTGTLNATATGLSSETPYDVYVQTKCTSNTFSDWEGPQNFTTDAIPCATPTALIIDNFDEDSVNFSWTASPDETDGYNWAVFAAGANINTATPVATGDVVTGTLNATATGLSPETPYDVYVQTKCTSNTFSDWEGPQNFTTDAIPCATPTDLTIDTFTEVSVNFSWTASLDETDGYNWAVFAAGANINTATPVATGNVATGILNASATGLSPNTPYDIYVQSKCTSNTTSDWEGPQTFTTDNLSTQNFKNLDNLSLYPNPVSSILTIESKTMITSIEIYNLLGQKVYNSQINKTDYKIDLSLLEKGTYFIKVYKNNLFKNFKIIKE